MDIPGSPPLSARGEALIKIGNRQFKLKASFEALEGIEEQIKESVLLVLMRLAKGDVRFKDIRVVAFHLIRAGYDKDEKNPISNKELGELLFANDYAAIAVEILKPLADAVTAGKDELPNAEKPN